MKIKVSSHGQMLLLFNGIFNKIKQSFQRINVPHGEREERIQVNCYSDFVTNKMPK